MPKSRLTIVVCGMVASDLYQGGAAWAVLQYVLGFQRLGCDVYLVEPIAPSSLSPTGSSLGDSKNAHFFREIAHEFGLEQQATLLLVDGPQRVGLLENVVLDRARHADVLINISGMLTDVDLFSRIPVRIYLDLDPGFIQLWHAVQKIDMRFVGHTHFVTIGQAIDTPGCPIPNCGRKWLTTWQPIVLEHWPVAQEITYDGLTTVGNWRGYGSLEYEGVTYGQKAHSWRRFMALPTKTSEHFMPALSIHLGESRDIKAFAANGWQLLDPAVVAGTPSAYRDFIQRSKGEFGIAKSGYVAGRTGWFSDRSLCYLASGRPVLAQKTGFEHYLPTGDGLIAFDTEREVLAGIESINSDYPRHRRSARALAEEYFDSDRVLSRLLSQVGINI